jgi:cyclin H
MATSNDMASAQPLADAKKPLYEAGTQFSHWRFSPQQLARTRQSLNEAAVAVIRRAFENDVASLFGRRQHES